MLWFIGYKKERIKHHVVFSIKNDIKDTWAAQNFSTSKYLQYLIKITAINCEGYRSKW